SPCPPTPAGARARAPPRARSPRRSRAGYRAPWYKTQIPPESGSTRTSPNPARASRRARGGRELERHEPGAGLQDPRRLGEPRVQVGEVAEPEGAQRAVELRVGEGERERVGPHRPDAGGLPAAAHEHREREVGAEHAPREPRRPGERGREVERAGAQVEIQPVGPALPAEPPHRRPAP